MVELKDYLGQAIAIIKSQRTLAAHNNKTVKTNGQVALLAKVPLAFFVRWGKSLNVFLSHVTNERPHYPARV